MTIEEKLILIRNKAGELKTKFAGMAIIAETGLSLLDKVQTSEISMTDSQKQAIVESYLILKADIINKFKELP